MDRPDLHIIGELSIRLFFGFPVADKVKDLQIRMGGGDHPEGGGLSGPLALIRRTLPFESSMACCSSVGITTRCSTPIFLD
jgi:hypothetical protein